MDWDLRPRTQNPGPETQDSDPCPGPEICGQGLGSVLRTVLTFLARMIFVILKYSLQINIDINNEILKKKSVF